MAKSNTKTQKKKNHHSLRKLIGTIAIAGATYAAEKIIESRKNKKTPNNNKQFS